MTDAPANGVFGVETLHLDLPPLVGALSRLLRERGVAVTPERAASLARALTLVRPITRRRLYWTVRAVFVTDPTQVRAFDAVFLSVFGGVIGDDAAPTDAETTTSPPDDRRRREHATDRDADRQSTSISSSSPGDAKDEERPTSRCRCSGRATTSSSAPRASTRSSRARSHSSTGSCRASGSRHPSGSRAATKRGVAGSASTCDGRSGGATEPVATRFASSGAGGVSRDAGLCCSATSRARWSPTPAHTSSS